MLLYNTPKKALDNLKNYKDFKVAILDQSNDLQTKKKIKKILPNLIYYKITDQNNGFAKGVNSLVEKVKTKFFLCTQPDVNISSKSIINLKNIFLKKGDAIISIPNLSYKKNFIIKRKKNYKKVKSFIGAVFLSKKKEFKKFKMFDTNFFFYWEDVDLSKRIENSKKSIYLNLDIPAKHNNSKSTNPSLKSLFIRFSNFKFGEYLFQYKNNRLRLIKMIREPIINFFLLIFYILIFQRVRALKKLFTLVGILNFFRFLIFKKI